MTKKFSAPRGTNDILPGQTPLWQEIESKARSIFKLYNYKEIRTPIFEETALFTRSLGETSDVVQKQMLNLEKEGLALRPEGTASVVRAYLENSIDKKQGLAKLYYLGPMFRGERPQKGRLRQFHQIGVEVIGSGTSHPFLDAEIIALSVHLLEEFGLKGFKLKINSLGSKDDKEKLSIVLRNQLKKGLSRLCKDCQQRFERNVFRILDCKNEQCKKVIKEIDIGQSYLSEVSKKYFTQVQESLKVLGVSFEISPYLVRGLDYYTHTVFEISHENLGSQDALGAGGRYNTLLQDLGGGELLGGSGFALGIERIILAGADQILKAKSSLDVFIIYTTEKKKYEGEIEEQINQKAEDFSKSRGPVYQKAFELLNAFRHNGISTDMIHNPTLFKKQLSLASENEKARFAVIIGEDELKEGVFTLKDLTARTQEKVPSNKIIEAVKKKLC